MNLHSLQQLGRSVVVRPGDVVPDAWGDATVVRVNQTILDDRPAAEALVDRLHRSWVKREPLVIELAVDPAVLRKPETSPMDPWRLRRGFLFTRERLHHLVWANSYDMRTGELIWWWGRKAEALGAEPSEGRDITLGDGTEVWVDGGPRGPVAGLDDPVVHAESIALGSLPSLLPSYPDMVDELAPDQAAAAMHQAGPARIIAPAGSGKTRTLTARVRHLVEDRRIEPEIICALAYNNRAAAEMRERLGSRPGLKVRTIHSLGWEILRQARGNVALLDERDHRRRLDDLVEAPRRPNSDTIGPYLEALGEVRIALRPPDEVEAFRDDVPDFARVYERYRGLLSDRGEADFDEQIYGAIEALLTMPDLRRHWQGKCRHMVVDEFQDLTPSYLLLIRLLASPELNVFGVGDDDQVIYGYLGADPGFLIDYDRLFPGAVSHPLEVNYRCPPSVVTAAATLLEYNDRRVPKVIKAGTAQEEPDALAIDLLPGSELGLQCAVRVGDWLGETSPTDIAVLCRVNSALLPVHVAFAKTGIPFRSPLGSGVLERTVTAAALAWIRIGLDPDSIRSSDLMKIVRRPARGLTRLTHQMVGRRNRVSLDDLYAMGGKLDGNQATKWDGFCDDIARAVEVAEGGDSIVMLDVINDEIGLSGAAAALDAGRRRADRSAQSDDLVALRRAAVLHRELADFEAWLRSSLSHPDDADGVELSTVHRVKGMEWDRVVVFGADRGLFPHDLAEDPEEERRVFHVAITRGRKQVVVLADKARPSPFLAELTGETERGADTTAVRKSSKSDGVAVALGDRVRIAGGYSGVIEAFEDDGAVVTLDSGSSSMLVAWGETVTTPGGSGPLVRPVAAADVDEALVEKLKAWRIETAVASSVPAYVVMNDKTLLAIAATRPQTERDLIMISGIGPAKLDAYGDEILRICS
ncbi:MAG: ATP-dependent DNA helicase UvrD2 [bacterium]|nr:ATP-dependent DNA helicase UvrD2 [bacterium]